jgi:amidohydrolase
LTIEQLKAAISKEIDKLSPQLGVLSQKIHDNPEIAMEEKRAAAWLVEFLKGKGFSVTKGIAGMPTAFRANYGKGKPVIAFLAEYDALPKIGHGCGHNLIATSAVAAGIATKLVADEYGGTVSVFGTPAEEVDAGKAIMAEKGVFDKLDAALITHPGGGNSVVMNALACQTLYVEFFGKAAHAAADPESGINALEAMILSYNAIDALRQHIREKARIHGIITDGGEAPNIVPAHTAATFIVRAEDDEYLDDLKERVIACFTGAASATGAKLNYRWDAVRYASLLNNITLAKLFQSNMKSLGRSIPLGERDKWSGSSDVGNVSQLAPTIQPMVGIAPPGVLIHSTEFAKVAASKEALKIMLDAAKAMAMTVADLLAEPKNLAAARAEFDKNKK